MGDEVLHAIMPESDTEKRRLAGQIMYYIAAKKGLKPDLVARKAGLPKKIVTNIFSRPGGYREEYFVRIAKALELERGYQQAFEWRETLKKALDGKENFQGICKQFLEYKPPPKKMDSDTRSKLRNYANAPNPTSEIFILYTLHLLGYETLTDMATAARYKSSPSPDKHQKDPLISFKPLQKEDITPFRHAVRFLIAHNGYGFQDLQLTGVSEGELQNFLQTAPDRFNFDSGRQQEFFRKLSAALKSRDPHELAPEAKRIGNVIYPHWEAFPAIFQQYRKSRLPAAAKAERREAINRGLPEPPPTVIERNEKIRLATLLWNKENASAAERIRYIDELEADVTTEAGRLPPIVTPYSVSAWLERLTGDLAQARSDRLRALRKRKEPSPPALVGNARTGPSILMQSIIEEAGATADYPISSDQKSPIPDRGKAAEQSEEKKKKANKINRLKMREKRKRELVAAPDEAQR